MNEKIQLKSFFIKLVSIVLSIIIIINFSINFILDRIPFLDDFSSMNKKQIRSEISEKIRNELTSALNKKNIFYEEDKKLIYSIYLKIKNEFKDFEKN